MDKTELLDQLIKIYDPKEIALNHLKTLTEAIRGNSFIGEDDKIQIEIELAAIAFFIEIIQ